MKKILIISIVLLLVAAASFMLNVSKETSQESLKYVIDTMKITSLAFEHNQSIPAKYTCDGENINPPPVFSDVPIEAKSLVLIMEDPDVPKTIRTDGMWDHWLVWDIDPTTREIKEGLSSDSPRFAGEAGALLKDGQEPQGVMGKNSGGGKGYSGPCPPDREHRYFFKLYALDLASLLLSDSASKTDLEKAMENYILAEAYLIGRYHR
jgi:Raf kinase inhibitor-like YbhB/YbcL family protein